MGGVMREYRKWVQTGEDSVNFCSWSWFLTSDRLFPKRLYVNPAANSCSYITWSLVRYAPPVGSGYKNSTSASTRFLSTLHLCVLANIDGSFWRAAFIRPYSFLGESACLEPQRHRRRSTVCSSSDQRYPKPCSQQTITSIHSRQRPQSPGVQQARQ